MKSAPMRGRTCWLCGRNGNGDPLDKHHIFGGANRKRSEAYGLWVPLCHSRCHENGPKAVHRNRETMQRLHEYGQKIMMTEFGWSRERFIAEVGRNYLPEDWSPETAEADAFAPEDERREN